MCASTLEDKHLPFLVEVMAHRGNYQQSVSLLSRSAPLLDEWITITNMRKYKAIYLSNTSQYDLSEVLASKARDDIYLEIKDVEVFSIMADTTPDLKHKDQMFLITRCVKGYFEVHEHLLKVTALSEKNRNGQEKMDIKSIKEPNLSTSG